MDLTVFAGLAMGGRGSKLVGHNIVVVDVVFIVDYHVVGPHEILQVLLGFINWVRGRCHLLLLSFFLLLAFEVRVTEIGIEQDQYKKD